MAGCVTPCARILETNAMNLAFFSTLNGWFLKAWSCSWGILTVCSTSGITKGSMGLSVLGIPYFFRSSCSSLAFCSSRLGPSADGAAFSAFCLVGGIFSALGFSVFLGALSFGERTACFVCFFSFGLSASVRSGFDLSVVDPCSCSAFAAFSFSATILSIIAPEISMTFPGRLLSAGAGVSAFSASCTGAEVLTSCAGGSSFRGAGFPETAGPLCSSGFKSFLSSAIRLPPSFWHEKRA